MSEAVYESCISLAFDTEVLRSCGQKYADAAEELRGMSAELGRCLGELKESGWTTPAGTAFYEMADNGWERSINSYAAVLELLGDLLEEAARQYDELAENEIERLRL